MWRYKLKHLYYGLKYFVINLWLFRKALWQSRSWDYHGLLMFMREQLDYMQRQQLKYGYHTNKEAHCRRMRECVLLLDRIMEDDYFKSDLITPEDDILAFDRYKWVPKYDYPKNLKRCLATDKQRKADLQRLTYLINKYLFNWWD